MLTETSFKLPSWTTSTTFFPVSQHNVTSRLIQHSLARILQPEPSQRPTASAFDSSWTCHHEPPTNILALLACIFSSSNHLPSSTTVNVFLLVPPAPRRSGTCCQKDFDLEESPKEFERQPLTHLGRVAIMPAAICTAQEARSCRLWAHNCTPYWTCTFS